MQMLFMHGPCHNYYQQKSLRGYHLTKLIFFNVPKDSNIGYILESNLEYPEELHNKRNDYPLAPEHLNITDDMSPFQQENFPAIRGSARKLVPNLMDKENYVLHYQNLQLYVRLGMKIKKIHCIIQFEQSC